MTRPKRIRAWAVYYPAHRKWLLFTLNVAGKTSGVAFPGTFTPDAPAKTKKKGKK